jgi:hypothetical protein
MMFKYIILNTLSNLTKREYVSTLSGSKSQSNR